MGKKKHNKRERAKDGPADLSWLEAAGVPPGLVQMLAKGAGGRRKAEPMLGGLLGSRATEQFVLGALAGAAAVYVMGDEDLRRKVVMTGMRLYSNVSGGLAELKEQMADAQAEMMVEEPDAS